MVLRSAQDRDSDSDDLLGNASKMRTSLRQARDYKGHVTTPCTSEISFDSGYAHESMQAEQRLRTIQGPPKYQQPQANTQFLSQMSLEHRERPGQPRVMPQQIRTKQHKVARRLLPQVESAHDFESFRGCSMPQLAQANVEVLAKLRHAACEETRRATADSPSPKANDYSVCSTLVGHTLSDRVYLNPSAQHPREDFSIADSSLPITNMSNLPWASKRSYSDRSPTDTNYYAQKSLRPTQEQGLESMKTSLSKPPEFLPNGVVANTPFLHRLCRQYEPSASSISAKQKIQSSTLKQHLYSTVRLGSTGIRLLSLQSRPKIGSEHEIHCMLGSYDRWRESVEYQCLSYCWGDDGGNKTIRISTNRQETSWTMPITTNLYDALQTLCRSSSSTLFWIDALCINQEDTDERAIQVAMMRDIYSKAAGVTIWLGEDTSGLSTALKFVKEITVRFEEDTSIKAADIIGSSGLRLSSEHVEQLAKYTMRSLGNPYKSVAQFFSTGWFRRVWVLQEAFSHAIVTVKFGKYTMPWGSIILAALWQAGFARAETASGEPGGIHSRAYLPDLWLGLLHTRPERGLSMMELVARARDFEASDPRDKIFALLGLANDLCDPSSRRSGLKPDYSSDKTTVYRRFARDLIATSGNLDVLSLVDTFARDRTSDTSWMPDLDVPIATIRGLGFPNKYSASRADLRTQLLDASQYGPESLPLAGTVSSHIEYVMAESMTLARNLRVYMHDNSDAIQHMWRTLVRDSTDNLTETQRLQSYIELVTATGFALPTEFPARPLGRIVPTREVPSVFADFAAYWARLEPDFSSFGDDTKSRLIVQAESGDPDQFGVLAGKACHERIFFRMADGRMGLGPRWSAVGDPVVILNGGSVPYVVRRNASGLWSFVGECYVDGIMFGEAQDSPSQERIFIFV